MYFLTMNQRCKDEFANESDSPGCVFGLHSVGGRMNRIRSFSLLIVIMLFLAVPSVSAEELRLSVAASMANVFKDLTRVFESVHPDLVVRLNFGSSGSLAKQIAYGAPADLFVSANPKWMAFLGEQGKTDKNTVRVFAYNTLVVVGDPERSLSSLSGLSAFERIALGSPGSVPAGQYAKQAMDHAGVYDALVRGHKLVMAKDARQALLYADRQEVPLAFVYKTDALLAKTATILYSVPPGFYDRVTYPIALTAAGVKNPSARLFYDFLARPEVVKILEQYGFEAGILTNKKAFTSGGSADGQTPGV